MLAAACHSSWAAVVWAPLFALALAVRLGGVVPMVAVEPNR